MALDAVLTAPTVDAGAARRAPLLTTFARWLDEATLATLCWAFDRTLVADGEDETTLRTSALPYLTPTLERDPRAFFAFVDALPAAVPVATTRAGRLPGGEVVAYDFASDYVSFDPNRDAAAARTPENARVPVRHWRHVDPPARATVVALHGFTMGHPKSDAAVLQARCWYDAGLDVVLPTLPFHGMRSPSWARYSGALFGSWHVGRLNEAVRQSVWDVHRLRAWLRVRDGRPVGVFGVSLGGYVAALSAELTAAWEFVMAVAPAVDLASLPCRLFARSRHGRRAGAPLDPATLRRAYRVHSPLTYPLQVAKERVLVVAGRGDRIVPPAHAEALWRHWGAPPIVWFGGGHVAPFRRAAIVAAGLAHLRRLGVVA